MKGLAKEFKELICRVAFHELYGYDQTIDYDNWFE